MNREAMFSSASNEWETPQDLFNKYDSIYHFTLDPASTDENAKCKNNFTVKDDGLSKNWGGQTVWLNPPYGREIGKWVKKAYEESQKPDTLVVCLIPARTDARWFHEYCVKGKIEFIRGRIKFGNAKNNAPFPSMLVAFGEKRKCSFCGGTLSEIRYHNGKPYRHCYGCNFDRDIEGGQLCHSQKK